jgi:hypothetical protein
MNGTKADFALIREEGSRIVIGYGLKKIKGTKLYEWFEIYIAKTKINHLSLQDVKDAIINDINARTDAKILNGYQFTPDGSETPVTVWLNTENQHNFQEAQRLQVIPVKFKLNEDENKQPIYHTFTTIEELNRFYTGGVVYVQQCLNEGWAEKDSIDWEPYETLFQVQNEVE